MAEKKLSAAQIAARQAASERMKAYHAAKKAKTNTPETEKVIISNTTPEEPKTISVPLDQWEKVMAIVERLEHPQTEAQVQAATAPQPIPVAPQGQLNSMGRPVGYTEKYPIEPTSYPNPIARLIEFFDTDRTLRRHGLADNYLLKWTVKGQVYETKWGTSVREPFFYVELWQRMFDEQGEDTGKSARVQQLILNEDEMEAQNLILEITGIDPNNVDFKTLMDEVRFERIKRWLVSIFKAGPNDFSTDEQLETVIDGKVVTIATNSKILA